MEKPHVKTFRKIFLQKYMEILASSETKQFVFLDETWVFDNGTVRRSWQDEDVRSVKRISGDGDRYIVVHAGTATGFVEDHLLPALDRPSIIILDNASYHSQLGEKRPTTAWRKAHLQEWPEKKRITFPDSAKKDALLQLCRNNLQEPVYAVDRMIQAAGHDVLRLPHTNAYLIQLKWYGVKQNASTIRNKVTAQQWQNYIRHTETIIKNYWKKERLVNVNELVINLNQDTDNSDSDVDN
ncbi:hypothetical protein Zmor_006135 [Zophobas morio]|uniref:Tc1-like transposase DDE domain-containing protein n=1 Tax=Zophobas morio TaxID=2755281 RepID=A0AA38IT62_9CUCU|nr:hypothetical protein Zmor_006135 [Zophobas morio]